jgi:hypothetical protein
MWGTNSCGTFSTQPAVPPERHRLELVCSKYRDNRAPESSRCLQFTGLVVLGWMMDSRHNVCSPKIQHVVRGSRAMGTQNCVRKRRQVFARLSVGAGTPTRRRGWSKRRSRLEFTLFCQRVSESMGTHRVRILVSKFSSFFIVRWSPLSSATPFDTFSRYLQSKPGFFERQST